MNASEFETELLLEAERKRNTMPLFARNVIGLVLAIAAIILLGSGFLIAVAIGRRFERERYFRRLDALRAQYGPAVSALLAGRLDHKSVLNRLRSISGPDRVFMVERLCLEQKPTPAQRPVLRRLCEDLGLVEVWRRDLAGKFLKESFVDSLSRPEGLLRRVGRLKFIVRARSAENLRLVRHQPSWPLLVKALDDPHPDVHTAAAGALGALQEPQSFSALVERLHASVLGPPANLSLRSVKAALVSFPLRQSIDLLPSLRHSDSRIRLVAADVIREMIDREAAAGSDLVLNSDALGPELVEVYLTRLCSDENPEVRARAAPVIACLPEGACSGDANPTTVLLRLLNDAEWFVRLHAVRALARPQKRLTAGLAAALVERLTDANWRVREAAARALLKLGPPGVDKLLEHLVSTQDRYSREQIIEEIERAGLLRTLLAHYAERAGSRERQAIEQFVNASKTSGLLAVLENGAGPEARDRFIKDFGRHADPQIRAWVEGIARD